MSGFIAREEIADSFKPGDHLSTFGGNPVSCAASLANIEFMLENHLADQALEKGEFLKKELAELAKRYKLIGEIRGKGLMIGIELVRDSQKTPANTEGNKIRDICLQLGLLPGLGGIYGNVLRIQPPIVISKEQLGELIKILDLAFSKV